jgi:hypothetical protein
MKLMNREKQEHCIGGDFVFIYRFDGEWNKERIKTLIHLGKLEYHGDFPRPFFQLRRLDGTVVKGVETAREFRVIFPRQNFTEAEAAFENLLRGLTDLL